jgi:hypothetical protein
LRTTLRLGKVWQVGQRKLLWRTSKKHSLTRQLRGGPTTSHQDCHHTPSSPDQRTSFHGRQLYRDRGAHSAPRVRGWADW